MTMTRAKTDDAARLEWLGVGGGFDEKLVAPLTAAVAHSRAVADHAGSEPELAN
jgi:hypothetical protein